MAATNAEVRASSYEEQAGILEGMVRELQAELASALAENQRLTAELGKRDQTCTATSFSRLTGERVNDHGF